MSLITDALDLSAFTSVNGDGFIKQTTTHRYYVSGLTLGSTTHLYKDYGANYFSGDFIHYLTATWDTTGANYALFYPWMLANQVDGFKDIDDESDSFLAVYLQRVDANGGVEVRMAECDSGTLYTDISTTLGSASDGKPFYLKVERDENVGSYGTLYCYIYTDPGRTELFDTLTLTLHTSKKDFRYFYALNSYGDGSSAQAITGWASEYYIDGDTPPDHLDTVRNQALVFKDTATKCMETFNQGGDAEGWTVGASYTDRQSDHYSQGSYSAGVTVAGDNNTGGSGYFAVSPSLNSFIIMADVFMDSGTSLGANTYASIFGSKYYVASPKDLELVNVEIYESSGTLYWRAAFCNGATPTWTRDTQTTYSVDYDTWYTVALVREYDPQSTTWFATIYVMKAGESTWTMVSQKGSCPSNIIEHVYLGWAYTPAAGSADGDFRVDNLHYLDGVTIGSAICRGGASDNTVVLSTAARNYHGTSQVATVFYSTADGVHGTWTESKTFAADNAVMSIVWDSANSKWWFAIQHVNAGDVSTWQTDIWDCTDITDSGTFTNRATLSGIVYLSRLVESGYIYYGMYYYDSDFAKEEEFFYARIGKFKTSDYSTSEAWLQRCDESPFGADYFPSEPYIWRTPTDNTLEALLRWDNSAGSPCTARTYHSCKDAYEATNEGVNQDSGTTTSTSASKLIDSGATWTSSPIVTVGSQVWNENTNAKTTVTAVDSDTQLSLAANIFTGAAGDSYIISCWGYGVSAGQTYYSRGGHMNAFEFKGYLWMQSFGGLNYYSPTDAIVAMADPDDMTLLTERHFGRKDLTDEPGNGGIDAKDNRVGNLWLDLATNFGPAWYLQVDSGMRANILIEVSDGFGLADSLLSQTEFNPAVSDGVGLNDTPSPQMVYNPAIIENLELDDAPTVYRETPLSLAENLTLDDAPANQVEFNPAITENLTLDDAPAAQLEANPSISEGLGLHDAPTSQVEFNPSVAEGVGLNDTPVFKVVFELEVSDGIGLGDTLVAHLVFNVSVSDGFALDEALVADYIAAVTIGRPKYRLEIHNSSGDLLYILKNPITASYSQALNEPHILDLTTPADEDAAAELKVPNELWLRDMDTGTIMRKFLIHFTDTRR